jgi:FMN phosphatase YigB (HAD superfamily)
MTRRLIFWDWTGTLADESRLDKAVCRSMERAIARRDGLTMVEAEARFLAHLKTLEHTWQWHDYIKHGRAFGVDWKRAQELNMDKLAVMPGAGQVLMTARARGYVNILATNAVQKVVELRLRHSGLEDLFDLVIGSDRAGALKAEGRHLEMGMTAFEGEPASSFAVGDHPDQDISPASRLGLKTICFALGARRTHYHSRHLKTGRPDDIRPDFRIETLPEILDII